jgi:hypothetical protein
MVTKSSNYKIQGTSNGHQMLYIYIYNIIIFSKILKCLITYFKMTIKWNLIHEIITLGISIMGCQILGLKRMVPTSSNYKTWSIYWPLDAKFIILFFQTY